MTTSTMTLTESLRTDFLSRITHAVSDIITAAVRQWYVPSQNPNKQKLAGTLLQAADRIKIWNGQ